MAAPMSALPSFFKVIHDHKQKEETRIPKFIAIKYWKGLSNPIFLRLPNGDEWRIFWEKRDDGIWLHKNWKNFADLNSLRFGSMLVFDYTGESRFQVRIFNPNTSECKYDNEDSHHEQVEKSGESDVILEESEANNIGPSKRTNNYGKKRIKVDFDDATQQEVSGADSGGMVKASCSKAEAIMEITRNFKSEIQNPFCVVILTTSYVQQQLLVMPTDFSRKHLYGLHGKATIGIGEDLTSTWDVSLKFDYSRVGTRLGAGWRTFCQDNNLQVGDACIFELLKRDPVTFKVHVSECKYDNEGSHHEQVEKRSESVVILEDSETNNIGPSKRTNNYGKKKIKVNFDVATPKEVPGADRGGMVKASCSKAEAIMEITRNFESEIENPFCVVILTPSYIKQNILAMPSDFSRKYLYGLHGNATFGMGEDLTSTWDVNFKFDYPRNGTLFRNGWRRFCQDNNLQVGDACIFELLKRDPVTFKVHVSIKL